VPKVVDAMLGGVKSHECGQKMLAGQIMGREPFNSHVVIYGSLLNFYSVYLRVEVGIPEDHGLDRGMSQLTKLPVCRLMFL